MKITFLGTNGWFGTKTGNTICTLVESEKFFVIFDAGDGIQKLDKYITVRKPVYLFLSHLHLDHVSGLHIFPKFKFKNEFTVCLPHGLGKNFARLADHPFTMPIKEAYPGLKIKKLATRPFSLPFPAEMRKLDHIDPSMGFRVTLDGKAVAYRCDTGKSEDALELARGADALIHECSNPPGFSDKSWGHSNPEEAAQVAKAAGAKKLFFTHFHP